MAKSKNRLCANMVPGSDQMKIVGVVLLLTVGMVLAGCFGADDEEEEGPPLEDPEPEPPGPPELSLTLGEIPAQRLVGDTLQVNVTVTGDNATADWAGIRWATDATAQLAGDNLTAAAFEGAAEADASVFPGDFSVDWELTDNGTFFVRAHVQANETDYWSDEFELEVLQIVAEGDFDADVVISIGLGLQFASYDPDPAEISVGDAVAWENNDLVAHTATHDGDGRYWDTGNIGSGDASEFSYRFNKAGTYEVICTIHPEMSAEIVVG